MTKFNRFAKQLDKVVKSYRSRYYKASEAVKQAQETLKKAEEENRHPLKRETLVQKIDRERMLFESRSNAEMANAEFEQIRGERFSVMATAEKLRAELAEEINKVYCANPSAIDPATMTLLSSGILTAQEYKTLSDSAISSENWTMSRLIAEHAKQALESNERHYGWTHPDNTTLRNVINRASINDGRQILADYDALKDCVRYAFGDPSGVTHRNENPEVMARWEEITGQTIEEF